MKPLSTMPIRNPARNARVAGFTLIELMIAVAVVGILAAVAYPAYTDQIRKGRRAEARTALMNLLQQQERYHTQNNTYASFGAGNPGTLPFTAYSSMSGSSTATASHQLGARVCQPVGGTSPGLRDCVEVFAEPRAGYPDPQLTMLAVDTQGRRTCTATVADRCWK